MSVMYKSVAEECLSCQKAMVPVVVNVCLSVRGSYSYSSTTVKLYLRSQTVKIFAPQFFVNIRNTYVYLLQKNVWLS